MFYMRPDEKGVTPLKVFVAGALHESHSFNSVLTPLSAFEDAEPGSILGQPGLADTRTTEGAQ